MGRGGDGRRDDGPLEVHLKGKVVDVTKFARNHPGGAKVLRIFRNRDATEQFEMCAVPGCPCHLSGMARHPCLKGVAIVPSVGTTRLLRIRSWMR